MVRHFVKQMACAGVHEKKVLFTMNCIHEKKEVLPMIRTIQMRQASESAGFNWGLVMVTGCNWIGEHDVVFLTDQNILRPETRYTTPNMCSSGISSASSTSDAQNLYQV